MCVGSFGLGFVWGMCVVLIFLQLIVVVRGLSILERAFQPPSGRPGEKVLGDFLVQVLVLGSGLEWKWRDRVRLGDGVVNALSPFRKGDAALTSLPTKIGIYPAIFTLSASPAS